MLLQLVVCQLSGDVIGYEESKCLCHVTNHLLSQYNSRVLLVKGRVPLNPKFLKFRSVHQMERTISVWSDRNVWDQL